MKRNTAILVVVCGISAAVSGVWFGLLPSHERPSDLLFSQTLPDATGQELQLAQFKDKVMVLNFWATWCEPCVEEIPEFSRVHLQYRTQDVRFLGIAIDNAANVASFAAKVPASYPSVVAGAKGTELSRLFGNKQGGLPYTVVLAADGKVLSTKLGRLHEDELRAILKGITTQ